MINSEKDPECSENTTITLTTNPLLDHVINLMEASMPDWDVISLEIQKKSNFLNINIDSGDLAGLVTETYLKCLLTKICSPFPDIDLNPIKNGAQSKDYDFVLDIKNYLYARNVYTGRDEVEYDTVTNISGLPVVWEAKLGNPGLRKNNKRRGGINYFFREDNINRVFKPLQQYFGQNQFGFILFTSSDIVKSHSTLQQHFIERGGKVVSLYTTYKGFHQDIQDFRSKLEL